MLRLCWRESVSTYAYPLIGQYISGTTASDLIEARLGAEEMGRETMCLLRRTRTAIWSGTGHACALAWIFTPLRSACQT